MSHPPHLERKRAYTKIVEMLKETMPYDQAMKESIGCWQLFDEIGEQEVRILRHYGLLPDHHLIEVGCGSGRLAKPLSEYLTGKYSGFDIVDELVDYAKQQVQRPDWRFESVDYISIPEPDHCADMVCFFSVFTHLLAEESYWYLEEAARVLKPGGKIVFSFLEFYSHWDTFQGILAATKHYSERPITVFTNREDITVWAMNLKLKVEDIRFGRDVLPNSPFGQSVCVLSTNPVAQLQAVENNKVLQAYCDVALQEKDAIIQAYESSTSWRITKPLRALKRLFKKVR